MAPPSYPPERNTPFIAPTSMSTAFGQSSGGSGPQKWHRAGDITTGNHHGLQNTHGVQGIFPIPIDFLKKQVDSVLSDIGTDVVKTGMLATSEIVKAVAALKAPLVVFGCGSELEG
eukprot:s7118_g1.t2